MKKLNYLLSIVMVTAMVVVLLPPNDAKASTEPIKVYILAGQSNMVGIGHNSALPSNLQGDLDTSVTIYAAGDVDPAMGNQFRELRAGFGWTQNQMGSELTFGLDMEDAAPNANIALIKVAYAGTNLGKDWNPADDADPTTGWCYYGGYNPYLDKPNQPGFKPTVLQQLAVLDQNWGEVEIAGMLWMQGESDTVTQVNTGGLQYAADYQANLTNFIQTVRQDFNAPNMPFVIGRIADLPEWTYRSAVRTAQANVANTVPNTTMINTDDLPIFDAPPGQWDVHYDAEGLMTLGSRFAEAMQSLTRATEWSQPQGFSSTQGKNQWYYHEASGSTYTPLTWNTNHWDGPDQWTKIYSDNVHPDTKDPALGWKAPYSGPIVISGNVKKDNVNGGDGVNVSIIRKSGSTYTTLWSSSLAYNDSTGLNYYIKTTANKNDMIYFRTNKKSNITADHTKWTPTIKSAWSYPYDFSSIQGENNWYYHEASGTGSGSTFTPLTWNTNRWDGSQTWTKIYSDNVHPDTTKEPALGWKAPNSGTVVISGNVKKYNVNGGDGVNVSIIKKGATYSTLWSNSLAYNDSTGVNYHITTTVNKGDMIYFRTNKKSNINADHTAWTPSITLTWNE